MQRWTFESLVKQRTGLALGAIVMLLIGSLVSSTFADEPAKFKASPSVLSLETAVLQQPIVPQPIVKTVLAINDASGQESATNSTTNTETKISALKTTENSAPAAADQHRIRKADRLKLRFYDRFDRTDLDGEYVVNDAGAIRLPRIGDFLAAEKTMSELEKDVRLEIEKRGEKAGYFTIEMAQLRPFYVAGYANHPGSYPYSPGLTVLHAIALAGGTYRSTAFNPADGIREKGQIIESSENLKILVAKLARLQAEKIGSSKIEVPAELNDLDPAQTSVEHQQEVLTSNAQFKQSKLAAIERKIDLTKNEADSYETALSASVDRISEQTKMFQAIKALSDRNIVNQQRLLETTVALDNAERDKQLMVSGLARTKSSLGIAKDELALFKLNENLRREEAIADLSSEISRVRAALQKSNSIAAIYDGIDFKEENFKFRIMRQGETGDYSFIDASLTSLIEPGDVLEIQKIGSRASTALN